MGHRGNFKKYASMKNKRQIIDRILDEMPDNRRLFRLSSGMGWAGNMLSNAKGRLVLKNAEPFHGTPEGWPDLAGWTIVEVTSEMIGCRLAVFTGLDVREFGELTTKQKIFKSVLEQMGGIYEVYDGQFE